MADPSAFFDLASTVLECVCLQMDEVAQTTQDYPGCPCLAYVSAGEPVIDCCEVDCEAQGMLAVHLGAVYPSTNFPEALEGFEPCKAATWVAEVVVTAARCAPSMDEQGHPASADELSESARVMAIDQWTILTALGCCVASDAPANKRKRRLRIAGSASLVGEGGCASVEVRALVEIGPVCNCPPEVS